MRGATPCSLLLAALLGPRLVRAAYRPPVKYLIISNARSGSISYVKLPGSEVVPLISGLGHPQGLAVDQKRQLLLVADSQLQKVVSYGLTVNGDGGLSVDEQTPVIENVESRWVSVDGAGNIYASDETGNRLIGLPAKRVLMGETAGEVVYAANEADLSPQKLPVEALRQQSPAVTFDQAQEVPSGLVQQRSTGGAALSSPGGVATDNFYLYWTNKVDGDQVGSIVRDLAYRPSASSGVGAQQPEVLATNVPKAYGVCVALGNVFFTSSERDVYAVKSTGGDVVTVSSNFSSPRGCAWDGDSTVYVADRAQNGVFALPGNAVSLSQAIATKVADFDDAFGVAVFSGAKTLCAWTTAHIFLISLFVQAIASTTKQ